MRTRFLPLLLATLVLLAASATRASAEIVVYTDREAFLAAIQPGYYLETFEGLGARRGYPSVVTFHGPHFSFTANADEGLFADVVLGVEVLTVDFIEDAFRVTSLSGRTPVTALGAYFHLDDAAGRIHPTGAMDVTVTDGAVTLVHHIPAPTTITTFLGFTSRDAPFTGLSFQRVAGSGWVGLNSFIMGTAGETVIPEPATLALLGAGLGLAAARRRLRRPC